MALEEQLREYIKLCEAGSTCEAMERFYADDVVVFENHELARAGRAACIGEDERPMRLDEVAVQRWSRGRIVEERFYYEGMVDEGDEEETSAA